MIWRMVAHADGLGRTLIPPELRSNPEAINAPVGLVPTASVDRTDQIPGGGASFKRRSGKFAANPSVLGYVRMAVAKEKAPARQNASRGHSSWGRGNASSHSSHARAGVDASA
jgi:hypothetical protein